jgi:hypothetical protein
MPRNERGADKEIHHRRQAVLDTAADDGRPEMRVLHTRLIAQLETTSVGQRSPALTEDGDTIADRDSGQCGHRTEMHPHRVRDAGSIDVSIPDVFDRPHVAALQRHVLAKVMAEQHHAGRGVRHRDRSGLVSGLELFLRKVVIDRADVQGDERIRQSLRVLNAAILRRRLCRGRGARTAGGSGKSLCRNGSTEGERHTECSKHARAFVHPMKHCNAVV